MNPRIPTLIADIRRTLDELERALTSKRAEPSAPRPTRLQTLAPQILAFAESIDRPFAAGELPNDWAPVRRTRALADLVAAGRLVRTGERRATKYALAGKEAADAALA